MHWPHYAIELVEFECFNGSSYPFGIDPFAFVRRKYRTLFILIRIGVIQHNNDGVNCWRSLKCFFGIFLWNIHIKKLSDSKEVSCIGFPNIMKVCVLFRFEKTILSSLGRWVCPFWNGDFVCFKRRFHRNVWRIMQRSVLKRISDFLWKI